MQVVVPVLRCQTLSWTTISCFGRGVWSGATDHGFVLMKRKMVLLVPATAGLEESVIGESRSKVRLSAL